MIACRRRRPSEDDLLRRAREIRQIWPGDLVRHLGVTAAEEADLLDRWWGRGLLTARRNRLYGTSYVWTGRAA